MEGSEDNEISKIHGRTSTNVLSRSYESQQAFTCKSVSSSPVLYKYFSSYIMFLKECSMSLIVMINCLWMNYN